MNIKNIFSSSLTAKSNHLSPWCFTMYLSIYGLSRSMDNWL